MVSNARRSSACSTRRIGSSKSSFPCRWTVSTYSYCGCFRSQANAGSSCTIKGKRSGGVSGCRPSQPARDCPASCCGVNCERNARTYSRCTCQSGRAARIHRPLAADLLFAAQARAWQLAQRGLGVQQGVNRVRRPTYARYARIGYRNLVPRAVNLLVHPAVDRGPCRAGREQSSSGQHEQARALLRLHRLHGYATRETPKACSTTCMVPRSRGSSRTRSAMVVKNSSIGPPTVHARKRALVSAGLR